MKNIKFLFYTLITLFIFTACTNEDEINQDCFNCTNTLTEYCIAQGDDFYTVSVNGATATSVALNGEFWDDIRTQIEYECNQDCFTCTYTETLYCYNELDDFYTVNNNGNITNVPLNNISWIQQKAIINSLCTDTYSCDFNQNEYLYIQDANYYTAYFNNGNILQVELDGSTWENIKIELENTCPIKHAIMTANIDNTQFDNLQPLGFPTSNAVAVSNFGNDNYQNFLRIDGNDSPEDYTNSTREISIYIDDDFWTEGTYDLIPFSIGLLDQNVVLIDMEYSEIGLIAEEFIGGTLTITNFNTETKIIQGTFEFTYQVFDVPNSTSSGVLSVTNGTFDYSLDAPEFN